MLHRTVALVSDRLAPWLSARLGCAVGIDSVSAPAGNGFSSETLIVDAAAGNDRLGFAVRFENPAERSLFMNPDIGFQFTMIEALARTGAIPVPAPIGLESDAGILGAPFMVTARVPGRAPPQRPNFNVAGWVAVLPPTERAALWRDGITAMARVHRLDWQEDGFTFLDQPPLGSNGLDQMLEATRRWYLWANRGRPHRLVELALERLARTQPPRSDDGVLWGDASITNMLFDHGRVSAVLDWEIAALGPAEIDLAWWLFFQDYLSRGFGHPLLAGIPDREETIALYEDTFGRSVRDLAYYELLTATRNAIMSMRSVNRQVALGTIPDNTRAITDNPSARLLAEQLGVTPPVVGADYATYLAAVLGGKQPPPARKPR